MLAIDTAGRAVLFAGTTVVISLLGMLIMGMSFVTGLAVGAAIVVAVTMVASLTLLPALLGFAEHRVEVTRWRGLDRRRLLVAVGAGRRGPRRPGAVGFAFLLAVRRARRRVLRRAAAPRGAPPGPSPICAARSPTAGAA